MGKVKMFIFGAGAGVLLLVLLPLVVLAVLGIFSSWRNSICETSSPESRATTTCAGADCTTAETAALLAEFDTAFKGARCDDADRSCELYCGTVPAARQSEVCGYAYKKAPLKKMEDIAYRINSMEKERFVPPPPLDNSKETRSFLTRALCGAKASSYIWASCECVL